MTSPICVELRGGADAPSRLVVPLAVGTGLYKGSQSGSALVQGPISSRSPSASPLSLPVALGALPPLTGRFSADRLGRLPPWATAAADTASRPSMAHDPPAFARQRRWHGPLGSVQRLDRCDR